MPNLPPIASGYLMVGFLIVAAVSAWLNLEQAQTIDSVGDVASAEARMSKIRTQIESEREKINDSETKDKEKDAAREYIKELNDELEDVREDLKAQRQDVVENIAGMLNGSWFWTLLIQVGAAAFGIGLINLICSRKEDAMVRSAALIVIGAVIIFMLLSRVMIFSAASDAARASSTKILR